MINKIKKALIQMTVILISIPEIIPLIPLKSAGRNIINNTIIKQAILKIQNEINLLNDEIFHII